MRDGSVRTIFVNRERDARGAATRDFQAWTLFRQQRSIAVQTVKGQGAKVDGACPAKAHAAGWRGELAADDQIGLVSGGMRGACRSQSQTDAKAWQGFRHVSEWGQVRAGEVGSRLQVTQRECDRTVQRNFVRGGQG
ncbi:hypothetical protein D3C72_1294740 [compost metagenome]